MNDTKNSIPITVLMPVYNGESYLRQTVNSFLEQTFPDFEFIVVNDFSTDRTAEIMANYQDPRIRVLHNERNLKISLTINRGLEAARGRFVALTNHDDISRSDRLEKQYTFLTKRPDFCGVGSWFLEMDSSGRIQRKHKTPTDAAVFSFRIITENPIANSSAMIATDVLRKVGGYDSSYLAGIEDWDIFSRITAAGYKMTNLPDTLIKYRKYEESYSRSTGLKTRHDEIPRLIRRNLRELANLELDETEACLFYYARYLPRQINLETLAQALVVCRKVTEALREIANCTKTKHELNRLEAFLNLHLASAALASGKRSLARELYFTMARHAQRPFGALARYCSTFLGDDFWKKLQGNRY